MEKYKKTFSVNEIQQLRKLIEQRCSSNENAQKKIIRARMRGIGFYGEKCFGIRDMTIQKFDELISSGRIKVTGEQPVQNNKEIVKEKGKCKCFSSLIDCDSEILILGTMPGKKSLESGEYYANANNCFWKIIRDVFNCGEELKDYKEKCDCLKKHHIALWDVLASCEREGSLDENIADEVPNDIVGLLKQYHKIKKIIFNGQKPKEMFKQEEVTCDCLVAPSTSSANTNMTYDEKLKYWKGLLSLEKTK